MGLLKKNPFLFIWMLLCLLACAAGIYVVLQEKNKVAEARERIDSEKNRLQSLLRADPAPTPENVEKSARNVESLKRELQAIRRDLDQGDRLDISEDEVDVLTGIQRYISEYRSKIENHTNPQGEREPIGTPEDFAFGFPQYLDEATPPDREAAIPLLDKQRQILSHILDQLIASNPDSIESVKRGLVERGSREKRQRGENEDGGGFQIKPAISARVPGAIETMAFSVTFTGFTDSLREFLNKISEFKLPLVVRSIEVERPSGGETTIERPGNGGGLDDIFGSFDDSEGEEPEGELELEGRQLPSEAQKPVIEENVSRFTVVLEFIEVVLPEAKGGEDDESDS